ncbi:MAG TPA: hypothetical protein PLA92_08375 [Fimbriimonadaceae bacterium]|nr:hypothetical protein [Fimbriimonadaceae bacterium]
MAPALPHPGAREKRNCGERRPPARRRVTLSGDSPEVYKWFLVQAVTSTLQSIKSEPAMIYAPEGAVQLQLAV